MKHVPIRSYTMFAWLVYAIVTTSVHKQLAYIFHDLAELSETDIHLRNDVMYKELKRHWIYLKRFEDEDHAEKKENLLLAIGEFQINYYKNGTDVLA